MAVVQRNQEFSGSHELKRNPHAFAMKSIDLVNREFDPLFNCDEAQFWDPVPQPNLGKAGHVEGSGPKPHTPLAGAGWETDRKKRKTGCEKAAYSEFHELSEKPVSELHCLAEQLLKQHRYLGQHHPMLMKRITDHQSRKYKTLLSSSGLQRGTELFSHHEKLERGHAIEGDLCGLAYDPSDLEGRPLDSALIWPFLCIWDSFQCPLTFKSELEWVSHEILQHRQLYQWTCDFHECGYSVHNIDEFAFHLSEKHASEDIFVVDRCRDRGLLDNRLSFWDKVESCRKPTGRHPQDEACKFCGDMFTSWDQLFAHSAEHMLEISQRTFSLIETSQKKTQGADNLDTALRQMVPAISSSSHGFSNTGGNPFPSISGKDPMPISAKLELIDRTMLGLILTLHLEFQKVRRSAANDLPESSQIAGSPSKSDSHQKAPSSGLQSSKKRKLADQQDNGSDQTNRGDEEEDDNQHRDDRDTMGAQKKWLDCPYYKKNPQKYGQRGKTCLGGWPTISRLKEHLYKHHRRLRHQCHRCGDDFDTENNLRVHQAADPRCPSKDFEPLDGFDSTQEIQMRFKGKVDGGDIGKWNKIFRILFGNDVPIPSPFWSPCTLPSSEALDRYHSHMTRATVKRLRSDLYRAIEPMTGAQGVGKKIVELVTTSAQKTLSRATEGELGNQQLGSTEYFHNNVNDDDRPPTTSSIKCGLPGGDRDLKDEPSLGEGLESVGGVPSLPFAEECNQDPVLPTSSGTCTALDPFYCYSDLFTLDFTNFDSSGY